MHDDAFPLDGRLLGPADPPARLGVPRRLSAAGILLEPLQRAHAREIAAWAQQAPDSFGLLVSQPAVCGGAAGLVERLLERRTLGVGESYAVCDAADGQLIGYVGLNLFVPAQRRIEFGSIWLAPPARGSVAFLACALLLLERAFGEIGCNRVEIIADSRNERSQRAISRLGALREGTARAHMLAPDGIWRDSALFSLLRSEWPQTEARLRQLIAAASPLPARWS